MSRLTEYGSRTESIFGRMKWQQDRMLLDDLIFELQPVATGQRVPGENGFRLFKTRELVEQYAKYWLANTGFDARRILELGIWDGGSVALWFEHFHPRKHVAIDISKETDRPYFRRYVASRGLDSTIRTFDGVDQGDADALRRIVHDEFADELDLVIDDASHIYEPTKTSFETVFPLLRAGGIYIIEDWGWEHWKACYAPSSPLSAERGLTDLVFEVVGAAATSTQLISSVSVFQGFVSIERGDRRISQDTEFRIDRFVSRRPSSSRVRALAANRLERLKRRARSSLARGTRRLRRLWRRFPG